MFSDFQDVHGFTKECHSNGLSPGTSKQDLYIFQVTTEIFGERSWLRLPAQSQFSF